MRVAISGAGVAGTALAYWLDRAGHTPVLIEQAPRFRTGGYMIDFWGVGYRVAERMGIEEQLCELGYDVNCLRSVGRDGKVKSELGVEIFRRMLDDDFISLPAAIWLRRSTAPSTAESRPVTATASARSSNSATASA